MLSARELSHVPLHHCLAHNIDSEDQASPEDPQLDLFGIDPDCPKPQPKRQEKRQLTAEEEYAEIYNSLALNAEFELEGQQPRHNQTWSAHDDRQFLEKQMKTLLGLLGDDRCGDEQCRAVLDWVIGGILTWDDTQKTLLSFRTACEVNQVDPREFGEVILYHCIHKKIVPRYARLHLAAWRWLEHLPSKEASRAENRARLRWIFEPLLSEREIAISPLLPEPTRSKANAAFAMVCNEFGADLELTRRLLWFHCVHWRIAPFDIHARLVAEAHSGRGDYSTAA